MRVINLKEVTKEVKEAVIKINYNLENDLVELFRKAKANETNKTAKSILDDIIINQEIAKKGKVPLCQDTGVVVVFLEIGYDVSFEGDIYEAINEGVRQGYKEGYLRKSIVNHPFNRENTKDNTPAIIHTKLVTGDAIKLKIASKGGGSENMSKVTMLTPADGILGVKQLVLDTVFNAGGKPCPPIIVGIGIGGNLEKSALLSKEALLRDLDDSNEDETIKNLEIELYNEINKLGVGPMGVGGETTCLAVKINYYPMHIASLPVAINIQCHSSRHTEVII
ncbi:L(+)-tartrate dehydratase subunit alpha [Candidatus Izimaplasma bacterium HR1]|jgi:fumarate hydratase subunit alpha|uniref:fumarate hydratase n=1 Tax=Candidatus Izimoplasma sp. HR1 TaxID=1541959 RepID=UPI0004F9161B|nr:L(+)-tartrate dehydratase subunit alpha [Candidatus Izimaplasma bacterium HR1]